MYEFYVSLLGGGLQCLTFFTFSVTAADVDATQPLTHCYGECVFITYDNGCVVFICLLKLPDTSILLLWELVALPDAARFANLERI